MSLTGKLLIALVAVLAAVVLVVVAGALVFDPGPGDERRPPATSPAPSTSG
ncbi:hypothetical protein K378_03792 [Streptomyces sp. Amel2xB2]|uniref:hypothetical protein n=1 Tax=Streptomyces sp. Amel2xB2 TaxID=1305829 RepID=UPI000DBFD193|nr:hypothetical protein [Streptomyces sp. Amel2xB2]RAJ62441.1 hypothetical protein K378_03792 [Streptomyces sp. Amel2xB2]